MQLFSFWVFLLGLCLSSQSIAHTRWALDGLVKPRTDADGIKTGPCGAPRTTDRVTELVAGSTVQVKFESVIYHSGVFKISFSAAKDQNFVLLADNIKDFANQRFQTYSLTLPNQTCDACTLQLIQTMPDAGNSLYYSCADIRLIKPAPRDTTPLAPVSNLRLQADTQSISLTWQNPTQDYSQTMVVQSTAPLGEYPQAGLEYRQGATLGNGTIVLLGAKTEFTSAPLTDNTLYHFAVFSLDASHNYSQLVESSGQLSQSNHPPSVTLTAEQNGQVKQKVLTNGGKISIQARITDLDSADQHLIDWTGTDYQLLDLTTQDGAFSIDPSKLKPATYTIAARVTDSGSPNLSGQTELKLQIDEPLPPSTPAAGALGILDMIWLWAAFAVWRRAGRASLA